MFYVTTDFDFVVNELDYFQYSLINDADIFLSSPYRVFTNIFIHADFVHFLGNILGLGLSSLYERRVGAKRFLLVLFISFMVSNLSILFYSGDVVESGMSGGIFGLGAAGAILYCRLRPICRESFGMVNDR